MTLQDHMPLDLGRIAIGGKIYGFFVRTKAEPGAMARILLAASKFNLTIVNIYNSTPAKRGLPASFLVFYDFTSSNVTPEEVKRAMESAVNNTVVEVIEPLLPGVIVDTKHYPLETLGERAMIFGEALLKGWFIGVRKRFGSGGEAFLYYEGYEAGLEIYDMYSRLGVSRENMWSMFSATLMAIGAARRVDVEPPSESSQPLLVRVYGNMECELGRDSGKLFSQFLRGAIAGFASKVTGRDVVVVETKCIAKGDSYCEFEVSAV